MHWIQFIPFQKKLFAHWHCPVTEFQNWSRGQAVEIQDNPFHVVPKGQIQFFENGSNILPFSQITHE